MAYLTATEAARRLGKTDKTIRAWIEEGKLQAVHVNKRRLGISTDDVERLAQHLGIDAPATDNSNTHALEQRIEQLEQELSRLQERISLLEDKRATMDEKPPVNTPIVSYPIEENTSPSMPIVARPIFGQVEDMVSLKDFAEKHGVNERTARDHATKGIAGDILVTTERPRPGRINQVSRYLTPAQQKDAITYWTQHGVMFNSCPACPHDN